MGAVPYYVYPPARVTTWGSHRRLGDGNEYGARLGRVARRVARQARRTAATWSASETMLHGPVSLADNNKFL